MEAILDFLHTAKQGFGDTCRLLALRYLLTLFELHRLNSVRRDWKIIVNVI
jgi:hypothetical protein